MMEKILQDKLSIEAQKGDRTVAHHGSHPDPPHYSPYLEKAAIM